MTQKTDDLTPGDGKKSVGFGLSSVPWMLLGFCILSFGLFIPWLGYYWDDWPVVVSAVLRGVGFFWNFYSGERPLEGWIYFLTIPILGIKPVVWHIFILFMRWVTVVIMWWVLRGLWPRRQREVTWMAILFAIYPAFEQQVFPINFSAHWITFTLYFISLGLMIRSMRAAKRAWLWNGLAILLAAFHLWTLEYFAGLEFLRLLVIWIIVAESEHNLRRQLALALRRWLPYLLVIGAFTVWRLFIFDTGSSDPNEPELLNNLVVLPLSAIGQLFQFALQDFINIIFAAWAKTLKPEVFVLSDRLVLFSAIMSLLAFASMAYYLSRLKLGRSSPSDHAADQAWASQAMLLGFVAVLLGPLPVWLTNRFTIWGLYGSRFALASLFGASILWVATLEWITPRRLPKLLILSTLVGLAVGFHLRWTNDFRWIWKDELSFYWQLYWRAPYLKPGSTIASDGEFFPYVGRNSTALAINLLYPQSDYPGIDYWFYEINPGFLRDQNALEQGKPLNYSFRKFNFTGSTRDSVFISYESERGQCLWILSLGDEDNPDVAPMLAEALPFSNLSQIEKNSSNEPLEDIFGDEPAHEWCYYFQKADLARQFKDWQEVSRLGKEAQELGFAPNNPQEWIPFIEGYAMAGEWDNAVETTLHVRRVNRFLSPRLCRLWRHTLPAANPPSEVVPLLNDLFTRLECENLP